MSKLITCHGLVSTLRMQTMLSRPLSVLTGSNKDSFAILRNKPSISEQNPSRTLYTANALGVDRIDRLREMKKPLFLGSTKERYIERLMEYLNKDDFESIYKDDIVNLIGIAEDERDLDLIEQVAVKCVGTKTNNHGWGALLFRLYHKMGQLERAYNNLKDVDRFGNFFNFLSCYKILMAMLYDAERYEDVVKVLELSHERIKDLQHNETAGDDGTRREIPKETCLVALAALAKINTPEALDRAETLFNRLTVDDRGTGLRPASFVSYIACCNNKPKLALNLISNAQSRNYITLRELKIISLIKLNRHEDILLQLREYVTTVRRETNLLLRGTYSLIQDNLDSIEDANVRQEINDLLIDIKEHGHVSEASLEELLFKPINRNLQQFRGPGSYQRGPANSYQNNFHNDRNQNYQRYDNRQYQPRQPRNQFGDRQYDNYQNRQPRRSYEDDDDDRNFGGRNDHRNFGGRDDNRQPRRRFSYQNMNFD